MMGILSESFRRSAGVERSLSPSHPLLAWGKGRDEFPGIGRQNRVHTGTGAPQQGGDVASFVSGDATAHTKQNGLVLKWIEGLEIASALLGTLFHFHMPLQNHLTKR